VETPQDTKKAIKIGLLRPEDEYTTGDALYKVSVSYFKYGN